MKKIKIENKPMKNVKILWGKYKGLIIKPYLSAEDINIANENCVEQFLVEESGNDRLKIYKVFPNVKLMYDWLVLERCTNLDLSQGYKKDNSGELVKENGSFVFDGKKTFELYNDLVASGTVDFVTSQIKNYESAWNLILKSIELKNTFVGLHTIIEAIEPQAMESNVKQMSDFIKQMNDNDPENFRKIIETASLQNAMQTAKAEAKKEQVVKRNENKTAKK